MTNLQRLVGGLVALLLAIATVGLSQFRYSAVDPDEALLRLAWRSRGVRVDRCRAPTEAELANVPAHMRQAEICEGSNAPFLLRVTVDGEAVVADTVRPAGAHADRPLYVYRELPLRPGTHAVTVRFTPMETDSAEAVSLLLQDSVRLAAGQVALIAREGGDGPLHVTGATLGGDEQPRIR